MEDIKVIATLPDKIMEKLTKEQQDYYDKATTCWICAEKFTKDNYKVRDHCHYSGKFRGATHNSCNIKYRKPNFTPIFSIILVVMMLICSLKILVRVSDILIVYLITKNVTFHLPRVFV